MFVNRTYDAVMIDKMAKATLDAYEPGWENDDDSEDKLRRMRAAMPETFMVLMGLGIIHRPTGV